VSYNQKHNVENGEDNRDGMNENDSWNCGIEGETSDPQVLLLRQRQAKNLMATLLLSQGVPMLLAGDEFLRTQKGNNNAWCQDNEISWVDWSLADKNKDFLRFTTEMIKFRKRHPGLRRKGYFKGEFAKPALPAAIPAADSGVLAMPGAAPTAHPPIPYSLQGLADIYWHGVEPFGPDFSPYSRTIAYAIDGRFTGRDDVLNGSPDADVYVIINGCDVAMSFRVPPCPQRKKKWRRVVDTGLPSPQDIVPNEADGLLVAEGTRYTVGAFALVVMVSL